jgi:DNA-binding MarR family transcriptional regulator
MTNAAIDPALDPARLGLPAAGTAGPSLAIVDGGAVAADQGGGAGVLDLIDVFSTLCIANERVVTELAREVGITSTDMRALYFIAGGAPTPKRVAAHLGLTTGAMTSLVDRLERAGLVRREPNPADRRSLLLATTPRGAEVVGRAVALYRTLFTAAIPAADFELALRAFAGVDAQLRSAGDALEAARR